MSKQELGPLLEGVLPDVPVVADWEGGKPTCRLTLMGIDLGRFIVGETKDGRREFSRLTGGEDGKR